MKIKYESVTGEVTEVEVSEEIGAVIIDSRRKEENLARKERYHCYSLDAIDFEGLDYGTWDDNGAFPDENKSRVHYAFSKLTATQKRRILMVAKGLTLREISRIEDTDIKTIRGSVEGARKKFLKFF